MSRKINFGSHWFVRVIGVEVTEKHGCECASPQNSNVLMIIYNHVKNKYNIENVIFNCSVKLSGC